MESSRPHRYKNSFREGISTMETESMNMSMTKLIGGTRLPMITRNEPAIQTSESAQQIVDILQPIKIKKKMRRRSTKSSLDTKLLNKLMKKIAAPASKGIHVLGDSSSEERRKSSKKK